MIVGKSQKNEFGIGFKIFQRPFKFQCRLFHRKALFLSQLCPMSRITYTERADFLVDGKYRIAVCGEGEGQKFDSSLVVMEDMIERGKGNIMPLWLAGFTY